MDQKTVLPRPVEILIKFLQFLVVVLLIVNACTFIRNVNQGKRHGPGVIIDIRNLSMKYQDQEENILELLQ